MGDYKHQRFEGYPLYYTPMYFLNQTGLRISEALALRWTDINGNQLTVERQTSRDDNNNLKLTSLKNSLSYRTIGLEEEVLKTMKKFKMIQNQMILKSEAFRRNEDGIIFQNYLGNYLTPSTVRDSIRDYCEAGASLVFVSKRLGHKTIKTTADTYLDITQKIEEDELKKFASYTKRSN